MSISRRQFLRTAAATGVAANGACAAAYGAQRRPNLLWIMTDQQPVSTVGAYGNGTIKTPNLDRIAAEGVRFNQFHIAAFPCSPSRACMLTGRHAHNHGVVRNDVYLDDDVPALGDILKQAGYATGYVGKWHLSGSMYRDAPGRPPAHWYYSRVDNAERFTFDKVDGGTGEDVPVHGFDYWQGGWAQYRQYLRDVGLGELVDTTPVGNHNDLPSTGDGDHAVSKLPQEHHMASFFAQRAVNFLKQRGDDGEPFGLVVSFFGPHLPVAPPEPWDAMYPLEDVPLPANHDDDLRDKPLAQRRNRRCYKGDEWTENQFRDYVRRYWGYCSYIDHQIGQILKALDATGQADDTIVAFTSDHGDMVAAHGFVFKLCWCGYDELLRVPLLLRYPEVLKPGTSYDGLVSNVDVLPTVLDFMGIESPSGVDGRSFVSALAEDRPMYDSIVCNSMDFNLTVVTNRWKYVLNWQPRDLDELYDRQADAGELTNLAYDEAHADVVRDMRGRVEAWLDDTRHPYAHTIRAAMAKEPEKRVYDLWPEVTSFKYLGGNRFEYAYVWHAVDAPPKKEKYWSFTHFANAKYADDGDIAFRDTRWPEPSTLDWTAGGDYPLGRVEVEIPNTAGLGKYAVRIGLYNPTSRSRPGEFFRGRGNSVEVGNLFVEKKAGKVTGVRFETAQG
ncbi:MAG: sulfatase-like hydrolase/transferase [bacterium]|nr:sulfatase-like hydrolase/transferase [bacterium]